MKFQLVVAWRPIRGGAKKKAQQVGQTRSREREDYQIAETNGNPGRAVPTMESNDGRNGGAKTRSKRRTTPTVPADEEQTDDPGPRRTARHGPTPNEQRHRQTPTGDTQRSTTNENEAGHTLRPDQEGSGHDDRHRRHSTDRRRQRQRQPTNARGRRRRSAIDTDN